MRRLAQSLRRSCRAIVRRTLFVHRTQTHRCPQATALTVRAIPSRAKSEYPRCTFRTSGNAFVLRWASPACSPFCAVGGLRIPRNSCRGNGLRWAANRLSNLNANPLSIWYFPDPILRFVFCNHREVGLGARRLAGVPSSPVRVLLLCPLLYLPFLSFDLETLAISSFLITP